MDEVVVIPEMYARVWNKDKKMTMFLAGKNVAKIRLFLASDAARQEMQHDYGRFIADRKRRR